MRRAVNRVLAYPEGSRPRTAGLTAGHGAPPPSLSRERRKLPLGPARDNLCRHRRRRIWTGRTPLPPGPAECDPMGPDPSCLREKVVPKPLEPHQLVFSPNLRRTHAMIRALNPCGDRWVWDV